MNGQKLKYRPMTEAELHEADRHRAYREQDRFQKSIDAQYGLVAMARSDRGGFERNSRWIVTTCRSGSEQVIHDELIGKGIECWCPLEKIKTRPRRSLKPVDIYRPYFKGYLFVKVIPDNEAYVGLMSASRLKSIMGRDGIPFLMPHKLMDSLMLRVMKNKEDHDDKRALPLREGQHVMIRSGPFSDFQATVRRVIGARWSLLAEVEILGRMTAVELDIDSVESCS